MITIYRNARRIIKNVPDFCGLSSDEKPMDAKNGSTFLEIDTGNTFKFDEEGKNWYEQPQSGGGSDGTTDYTQLENKPSINGITLNGNQTTEELDIIPVVDLGEISGKLPIQITLNAEQIETMQKDNCIVTVSFQDLNLCLRKIGNFDTQIVFSGIAYDRSIYFLASGLQGTFNVFDIAQIPLPTGPNDAGKVPVVNPDGTGWLLGAGVGGGGVRIETIADTVVSEPVSSMTYNIPEWVKIVQFSLDFAPSTTGARGKIEVTFFGWNQITSGDLIPLPADKESDRFWGCYSGIVSCYEKLPAAVTTVRTAVFSTRTAGSLSDGISNRTFYVKSPDNKIETGTTVKIIGWG